jgi:polysaccharide export outer membrane protein
MIMPALEIVMRRIAFLLLLPCLGICQQLQAQQAVATQTDYSSQDYRVGPGDSLGIRVFGLSAFDQTIRVSNSGKIHVPHLGILKVADLTPFQIQTKIAQQLIERDLLKDPWVQVRIAQYRAHPVYILGEVMQPGQYLLKNDMYVMDLLSLAAGFNEVASKIGYLYRRKIEPSDAVAEDDPPILLTAEEAIEIDFQQLYAGTKPELNIKLRGGDVIYVPERKPSYYFVVGSVNKSGAFEMPFEQKVLVTQAIAEAGGPLKTAKMSKGMLLRYNEDGKRQEFAVDFKAILKGKEPDFPLLPSDIIFVPGSSAKTLGYGLLNMIPRLAQTAIFIP